MINKLYGGIGMYKIDTWYRGMSIMSAKEVIKNKCFNHGKITNCFKNGKITHGEDRIFFTPVLEVAKAYAVHKNNIGIVFECGVVGEKLYRETFEYFYTKDKIIGTGIIKKIYLIERINGKKKIIREISKEELLNGGIDNGKSK